MSMIGPTQRQPHNSSQLHVRTRKTIDKQTRPHPHPPNPIHSHKAKPQITQQDCEAAILLFQGLLNHSSLSCNRSAWKLLSDDLHSMHRSLTSYSAYLKRHAQRQQVGDCARLLLGGGVTAQLERHLAYAGAAQRSQL
jgi:hypothetical protein